MYLGTTLDGDTPTFDPDSLIAQDNSEFDINTILSQLTHTDVQANIRAESEENTYSKDFELMMKEFEMGHSDRGPENKRNIEESLPSESDTKEDPKSLDLKSQLTQMDTKSQNMNLFPVPTELVPNEPKPLDSNNSERNFRKDSSTVESHTERKSSFSFEPTNLRSLGIEPKQGTEDSHPTFTNEISKDVNTGMELDRLLYFEEPTRREQFLNDGWVRDIERKIEQQEIDQLYTRLRIGSVALEEGVRRIGEGGREISKPESEGLKRNIFRDSREAGVKQLLDRFEELESERIKEVKKEKENKFYSALKESSWSNTSISPVKTDRCAWIRQAIAGQFKGALTCFAYSPDCMSLLVIGTDQSELLELDLVSKKLRKHKTDDKVTCLDISADNEKIAVGLANGEVVIKKTRGSWISKLIKLSFKPINQVKFVSSLTVIAASDFSVFKVVLHDLKVYIELTKSFVVERSEHQITQIAVTPNGAIFTLIVTSSESVKGYLLNTTVEELFSIDKPYYVEKGVPTVSFLCPDDKDYSYVIIFWQTYIFLIKNEGPMSVIVGMKQLDEEIIWGCALRNRAIAILLKSFEIRIESIQSIFINLMSGGGFENKFRLSKDEFTQPRVISYDKEGKEYRAWSETVKNYSHNIYFLKADGVFQVYLLSLQEMAQAYCENGDWMPALKMCMEVCNSKIRANQEEKSVMKNELVKITGQYVDRFIDVNAKKADLQAKIARISIDALNSSGNLEFLFAKLRKKFDELLFWQEIDHFIENGLISWIPLDVLREGCIYLQADSLQTIVFSYKPAELLADETSYSLILSVVKRRKLWTTLYRLALIQLDIGMPMVLGLMLAESLSLDHARMLADMPKNIVSIPTANLQEFFDESKLSSFLRLFWFIKRVFAWHVYTLYDSSERMEETWFVVLNWVMDPSNIKVLSQMNISLYLELFFEFFMNPDFRTSDRIEEVVYPLIRLMNDRINTVQKIKGESESFSFHSQFFLEIINSLLVFSDKQYHLDISFLGLKLLVLGLFRDLTGESAFICKLIANLVSVKFPENRIWYHYESVPQSDYEEQIIKAIGMVLESPAFVSFQTELTETAHGCNYQRVYCHMIEILEGPTASLRRQLQLVDYGDHSHLFNWIKKKIMEPGSDSEKKEFSKEIIRNAKELVGENHSDP